MWPNPPFPADLVTFTEEILNGKLHFLCSKTLIVKRSFWDKFQFGIRFYIFEKDLKFENLEFKALTLSLRKPLSYRNQSIDLFLKPMDRFLYDNGLCHERVKDLL